MLGNKMSELDWAIIQITSPRPIRFVINKSNYHKWLLSFFKITDISRGGNENTLTLIKDSLNNGEIVCFFSESKISENKQLGELLKGFKECTNKKNGLILPFNLYGLLDESYSLPSNKQQELAQYARQNITVSLGDCYPLNSDLANVKEAAFNFSKSLQQ